MIEVLMDSSRSEIANDQSGDQDHVDEKASYFINQHGFYFSIVDIPTDGLEERFLSRLITHEFTFVSTIAERDDVYPESVLTSCFRISMRCGNYYIADSNGFSDTIDIEDNTDISINNLFVWLDDYEM
jgi:hypothetical protein